MKLIYVRTKSLISVVLLFTFFVAGTISRAGAANAPVAPVTTWHPGAMGANRSISVQSSSSQIYLRDGDDLQAALDSAVDGDDIVLEAGATFQGNFVLRNNHSSGWISIRSSADDNALPSPDTRVSPSFSNVLPKIVSPNTGPALKTEGAAHNYRLIGLEITIGSNVMLNYGILTLGGGGERDAGLLPHDLVIDRCYVHGHALADVSRGIALNSASTEIVGSYISDIHGIGFDTQAIAGWNGPGPFKIVNNYLEAAGENVLFGGADPRIPELVPSDIEFRRNHVAKPLSWQEGIVAKPAGLVGSGQSASGGLIAGATYYYRISARSRAGYSSTASSAASNEIAVSLASGQTSSSLEWTPVQHATEYRVYRTSDDPTSETRNWVSRTTDTASIDDLGDWTPAASKPAESGTRWSTKNLFELKNARRVAIDGNVFENNWVDAQSGFAIQFTVRNQDGNAEWSVVEDVTFTNNIVRHSAAGINLLGRDDLHPSGQLKHVRITGNFFDDIGAKRWGNNGRFLQITETIDVKVDHNTVLQTGNIITAYGAPNQDFTFTNNIVPHNDYGIIGDGSTSGDRTLEQYFPTRVVKKNVIVGALQSRYPKKNFYPTRLEDVGFENRADGDYRLADTSTYKNAGTKDRDVGADFGILEKTAKQAVEGKP